MGSCQNFAFSFAILAVRDEKFSLVYRAPCNIHLGHCGRQAWFLVCLSLPKSAQLANRFDQRTELF